MIKYLWRYQLFSWLAKYIWIIPNFDLCLIYHIHSMRKKICVSNISYPHLFFFRYFGILLSGFDILVQRCFSRVFFFIRFSSVKNWMLELYPTRVLFTLTESNEWSVKKSRSSDFRFPSCKARAPTKENQLTQLN